MMYTIYSTSSSNLAARPTINLKSNLVIKSGNGTKKNPYIVGLPKDM